MTKRILVESFGVYMLILLDDDDDGGGGDILISLSRVIVVSDGNRKAQAATFETH